MKPIELRLYTQSGDEIESVQLEEFSIAEERDEATGGSNQEILERVSALYDALVTLLWERQAAPIRGNTWLKLILGEALITADEYEGGVVIAVPVRTIEGEDDGLDDSL
jgi:hypothetical protein